MLPEPWLRGDLPGVHPLIAPVLFSFRQAREDLARHSEGLSAAQLWTRPYGFGAAGFHIRHISGSVDRLVTYLNGSQLSDLQMAALHREMDPGADREELLAEMEEALTRAEHSLCALDVQDPGAPRTVGRKRLPTTVAGLLVHIAEHTQRHVGQAIGACKLARALEH